MKNKVGNQLYKAVTKKLETIFLKCKNFYEYFISQISYIVKLVINRRIKKMHNILYINLNIHWILCTNSNYLHLFVKRNSSTIRLVLGLLLIAALLINFVLVKGSLLTNKCS